MYMGALSECIFYVYECSFHQKKATDPTTWLLESPVKKAASVLNGWIISPSQISSCKGVCIGERVGICIFVYEVGVGTSWKQILCASGSGSGSSGPLRSLLFIKKEKEEKRRKNHLAISICIWVSGLLTLPQVQTSTRTCFVLCTVEIKVCIPVYIHTTEIRTLD